MLVTVIVVAALLAAVYGVIIFFSHTPRLPLPTEDTYTTNDGSGEHHQLPPRIHSKSKVHNYGIDLSVVIPCYNETKRLGKMLDDAITHLRTTKLTYEFLIVDDGSSDGTAEYAISLANKYKLPPHTLRVVQLAKNRGKGGAVTHGILHSRGKLSLFADADGATSFRDVDKLVDYFQQDQTQSARIAIGSRAHMVNTDAVVKRSFIRNFLMYGLHTLVYIFGIRDVKDTQCGFKMFNFESARKIFPHMHTERWIFDVEVLLLAELQGIPIGELPVNWEEVDGSKVNLAKDSIDMAIDLVVTRLAYILGVYGLDECGRDTKKHE